MARMHNTDEAQRRRVLGLQPFPVSAYAPSRELDGSQLSVCLSVELGMRPMRWCPGGRRGSTRRCGLQPRCCWRETWRLRASMCSHEDAVLYRRRRMRLRVFPGPGSMRSGAGRSRRPHRHADCRQHSCLPYLRSMLDGAWIALALGSPRPVRSWWKRAPVLDLRMALCRDLRPTPAAFFALGTEGTTAPVPDRPYRQCNLC